MRLPRDRRAPRCRRWCRRREPARQPSSGESRSGSVSVSRPPSSRSDWASSRRCSRRSVVCSAAPSSWINLLGRKGLLRRAVVFAPARGRGRDHPATPSRGRVDEPCHWVSATGREEGAGEAARLHRGSRRYRRVVHRQDRHTGPRDDITFERALDPTGAESEIACPPSDSSATRICGRRRRRRWQRIGCRTVGKSPRVDPLASPSIDGSTSRRSIMTDVVSRCSPNTTGRRSSSPRAPPKQSSTAAPMFPTKHANCSTPSSTRATASWPSPAGQLPSSPR